MAKMEKDKLKTMDLTAILFIKTQVRPQGSKNKIILLKSIFNFILTKVQDAVGTVKQHNAVVNEGDVSLFLIGFVGGVEKLLVQHRAPLRTFPKTCDERSSEMREISKWQRFSNDDAAFGELCMG